MYAALKHVVKNADKLAGLSAAWGIEDQNT